MGSLECGLSVTGTRPQLPGSGLSRAQLWDSTAACTAGSPERPQACGQKACDGGHTAVTPVTCGPSWPTLRASHTCPRRRPLPGPTSGLPALSQAQDSGPQPQAISTRCPHTASKACSLAQSPCHRRPWGLSLRLRRRVASCPGPGSHQEPPPGRPGPACPLGVGSPGWQLGRLCCGNQSAGRSP